MMREKKGKVNLPNSWEIVLLGEFVENQKGKKPNKESKEKTSAFNIPYINIEAFEDGVIRSWTDGEGCRFCNEDDFLMVWDGSRSGLVGKGMYGALGSTLIRINFPGIYNSYAYFFLKSKFLEINSRTKGSGTPHVNPDLLWNYEFPIPPLNEQKRIVAKIEELFSELDNGIESLKTAHEQLKVYRQAILKHAFEGRLTAIWREENKDKLENAGQLLERINKERRTKWEADLIAKGKDPAKVKYVEPAKPDIESLQDLSDGWSWATVEQIAQIQGGIQKQPSRTPQKNAFPYLRVANVFRGRLDLSVVEKMELFGNELDTLRLETGDLLIVEGNGSRSEIGRSALWRGEIEDCVHQNHIIRVRSKYVIPEYLDYYWNSSEGSRRVIEVAASTSGLYTLSVGKISRIPIPLPPLAEQEQIVAEVEQHLSLVTQLETIIEANLKRAERLRQSILKEAFAGQLVPQDPNDEPASVLLERIRTEKTTSQAIIKTNHYHKVEPVKEYTQGFLIPETAV